MVSIRVLSQCLWLTFPLIVVLKATFCYMGMSNTKTFGFNKYNAISNDGCPVFEVFWNLFCIRNFVLNVPAAVHKLSILIDEFRLMFDSSFHSLPLCAANTKVIYFIYLGMIYGGLRAFCSVLPMHLIVIHERTSNHCIRNRPLKVPPLWNLKSRDAIFLFSKMAIVFFYKIHVVLR